MKCERELKDFGIRNGVTEFHHCLHMSAYISNAQMQIYCKNTASKLHKRNIKLRWKSIQVKVTMRARNP